MRIFTAVLLLSGACFDGNSQSSDDLFSTPVKYHVGREPSSLVAADINGDSIPDIVIGGRDAAFEVLLGNGDGTFRSRISNSTADSTRGFLSCGDLNGDGKDEVVVYSLSPENYGVAVYSSTEDELGFSRRMIALPARQPGELLRIGRPAPLLRDLNNDQRLDLVIADFTNGGVSMYLQNESGEFSEVKQFASEKNTQTMCVADFNSDAQLDVLLVRTDHRIVGSPGTELEFAL